MKYELKPLDQQVVVITGASSGIGLCTAAMAADKGCKLALAARSESVLAELCSEIRMAGGEAVYCVADVGKREDVDEIARVAIERFGRIDTWVNDAGVAIYGRVWEVSDEDSRRLFDTNFWGVVYGSLAALPYLRQTRGALINIGSEVSDAVVPLQVMYSSSKHAVKGFTDGLRIELEAEGTPVSVTLIQPTAVNTPYPEHARNYMDKEPKLPSPQIDPSKVAQAILHAAAEPERDVTVGAMAKLNTMNFKIMPRLADWMAKHYVTRQSYDAPPIDPQGTLYKAGEGGRIHGRPPQARH
jgi:short-subunit dehydrogenase